MKRNVYRLGGLVFFNLLLLAQLSAQDNCTFKLNQADENFREGIFNDIPSLLEGCIADGFNREQRTRAWKLLTMTYIFQDDLVQAEKAMIQLLKVDPEHQIDPDIDPASFIYFYNKFRWKPIFRLGFKAGANFTNTNNGELFGVHNTSMSNESFGSEPGLSGEIFIDYELWKRLEISVGLGFNSRLVTYENTLFGYTTTTSRDRYNSLLLPAALKYNWNFGRIYLYPFAGVAFDYFFSANRLAERDGAAESIDLLSTRLRQKLNLSAIGGLGLKYKVRTHFIVVEARYSYGINNIVDGSERYSVQDLPFRLGQVDNNMAINHLAVTIGYLRSIYNPKKVR